MAQAYLDQSRLNWPLLLDEKLTLYSAYGMTRGSWLDIYGPASIWRYITLIAGGRLPGKPGRDWRQLGGNVLIDPNGVVRLHHVSATPHDRPDVQSILNIVRAGQDR